MIKISGTIQGRMGLTLSVVCLAIAVLSGLSLYSIASTERALRENTASSGAASVRLNQLRDAVDTSFSHTDASHTLARRTHQMFTDVAAKMEGDIQAERERSTNALDHLWWLMLVVTFLALVMPALSLYITGRTINRDLNELTGALGHFCVQNDQTSETLREASQNLSAASAEQSAAVQESVASIAEIRSMLAQTSNHVREVRTLTTAANDKTHDGSQTMARMESAVMAIEDANAQLQSFAEIIRSIREKTQVINDIVFKTQLLSFNASIEAARAGQYGRGFAVVAEEVGKLAQSSGAAAKDIDQLLSDSQRRVVQVVEALQARVSDGRQVSEDALKRFKEIAGQISIIAEKVNQVGEATQEQESGVEQTARAMDQMDATALDAKKAADQIFAIAEEVGRSSANIRETAGQIERYVRATPATADHAPEGPNKTLRFTPRGATTKMAKSAFTADDPSFRRTGEQ